VAKQAYISKQFNASNLKVVQQAIDICQTYVAQGYRLTVRQAYYQFVSRGLMENTVQNYKRLASVLADARLAGLIDWDWIEDRLRVVSELAHWDDPSDIMKAVANQYRIEKWANQTYRPIVMIEKDALAGVIEPTCRTMDVPYLACRGYTSVSALREMAQRLLQHIGEDQTPVILHLGDHDPSGIDMTRDIRERLKLFMGGVEVKRLALNMDQVEQYNPPPNPARESDTRFAGYLQVYGDQSWELDALEPAVIVALVEDAILSVRDETLWQQALEEEQEQKDRLALVSDNWTEVATFVDELQNN
jgi:hypothetical protein